MNIRPASPPKPKIQDQVKRLSQPDLSSEQSKLLADSLAFSNPEHIQELVDYGTKIKLDERPVGNGYYHQLWNTVGVSSRGDANPEVFANTLNHELLGHALITARSNQNRSPLQKTLGNALEQITHKGFGISRRQIVRGVKEEYRAFRDRVLLERALVSSKVEGRAQSLPPELDSQTLTELAREINPKAKVSVSKPIRRKDFIEGLKATHALEILEDSSDGTHRRIKVRDRTKQSYGPLPKVLSLLGAAQLGVAAVQGSLSNSLAGVAMLGVGLATHAYQRGYFESGERSVELGDFQGKVQQQGNTYTFEMPAEVKPAGAEWSSYAYNTRDPEEYLAEGQALRNTSAKNRDRLKLSDPAVFNYLSRTLG